ncbi:MAG: response regulator [Flavobacteriales bacterium]|nr:response regulator [Flavobacteriales bacterium]
MNILIAEDNESNYLLLKHILKEHTLTLAINGLDAVNNAKMTHYDAILMDMKMPVMGGLEATRKIREFDPNVPIIAITANAFESDKLSAFDAGCNFFVAKPIKKEELISILNGLSVSDK